MKSALEFLLGIINDDEAHVELRIETAKVLVENNLQDEVTEEVID